MPISLVSEPDVRAAAKMKPLFQIGKHAARSASTARSRPLRRDGYYAGSGARAVQRRRCGALMTSTFSMSSASVSALVELRSRGAGRTGPSALPAGLAPTRGARRRPASVSTTTSPLPYGGSNACTARASCASLHRHRRAPWRRNKLTC